MYRGGLYLVTSQVFRDVGGWYHIVLTMDTTQATDSNRAKVYVNGVQVTSFSTATYPAQNYECPYFNTASQQLIGSGYAYFSGYLADVHFIDGTALGPDSFGEFDSTTGVWTPIAYTGSYGTNGFHLDFADNSSTTALGYDAAGSNDWTPNNFSVTAGTGNDSLTDTPTPYGTDTGAGGEVRGNYCTLNPLPQFTAVGTATPTNGNLDVSGTNKSVGTFQIDITDKWYYEVYVNAASNYDGPGWTTGASFNQNGSWGDNNSLFIYGANGEIYNNGWGSGYSTYTAGDTIGVGWDNGTVKFYKNNTLVHSYSSGVSAGTVVVPFAHGQSTMNFSYNFGQRPFAYTAPSGFKALCTTNLPEPDVVQGDTAFNTVLYTGNSSSSRTVTGVGFQT